MSILYPPFLVIFEGKHYPFFMFSLGRFAQSCDIDMIKVWNKSFGSKVCMKYRFGFTWEELQGEFLKKYFPLVRWVSSGGLLYLFWLKIVRCSISHGNIWKSYLESVHITKFWCYIASMVDWQIVIDRLSTILVVDNSYWRGMMMHGSSLTHCQNFIA